MRKRKKGRKFGRTKDQRKALLRNLAAALILKERIQTTEAKAKELRSFVEKSITIAKKSNALTAQRLLRKDFSEVVVRKLIGDFAKRYSQRPGGYTRVIKLGYRVSDSSKMTIIELVT